MLDPTTLFSYERDIDSRSINATTLLVTLGAFADSGQVQRLLGEHIDSLFTSRTIGSFDTDQIIDYTGVRPEISLNSDTIGGYEAPAIQLTEYSSDSGSFLVLSGPEPNFQWERVASATRIIIEQLGITRTLVASSFPGAMPHTRPTQVVRFAGNPSDITLPHPFPGQIDMRSSFPIMLALRLGEAGHSVIGLSAPVPSYAHELSYYPAVAAMLTAIETEGGPHLALTPQLEDSILATRRELDEAAANNEQLAGLIKGFEANFAKVDTITSAASDESGPLPGAETLGAEIENFLREVTDEGDTPRSL